jgi:uncharacterized protein YjdB
MKDLRKVFGIIFVAAIIVCAMAACDLLGGGGGGSTPTAPTSPTTPGNGTVTGVSLNKSSVNLLVGGAEALTPTITPSTATNQNVTWASSNTSTATVSAGGLVTAVAAGTATVTVTTVDGNKTAICIVTIAPTIPTFTSVAAFKTWLDAQANKPKDDPYNVALNLSIALMASKKY